MKYQLSSSSLFGAPLSYLPEDKKLMINTINAHSFNMAQKDRIFAKALGTSDILLPDGISVVYASRFLKGSRLKKIAGADLFEYEMRRLNLNSGSCFFLGCDDSTLKRITEKAALEFPKVKVHSFSPPYVKEFSKADNARMIKAVNLYNPDVLFIGMTAPKQEKWAYENFDSLAAKRICCIGAVFDFYAGNKNRAPRWMIYLGLEWFSRFISEPERLWRRYLIGNTLFIWLIIREKIRVVIKDIRRSSRRRKLAWRTTHI